jgi:hypothetical protein
VQVSKGVETGIDGNGGIRVEPLLFWFSLFSFSEEKTPLAASLCDVFFVLVFGNPLQSTSIS